MVTFRRRKTGKRWCSTLCRLITDELDKAQRAAESIGPTPFGVQLWAELVTLGDTWEQAQQIRNAVRKAALDVGISAEQWEAILAPSGDSAD